MTAARPAERVGPSALDLVAQRALRSLIEVPGTLRAGFAMTEGGDRQLLFTATDRGDDSGAFEWCRIDPTWDVPLNRAARDGDLVAGTLDQLEARYPAFVSGQRGTEVRSVVAVPVTHHDEHLGGTVLYLDHEQATDPRLLARLVVLGRTIGADLVGARHEHRRRGPVDGPEVPDAPGTVPDQCSRWATYEMPGDAGAVGAARRFLVATLGRWGLDGEVVDDAVLCLDELVTNALVHTHGGCRVHVGLDDAVLRVRVVDQGSLGPVRLQPADAAADAAATGRGLRIVDALASRSGRDPETCLAWFELDLPA